MSSCLLGALHRSMEFYVGSTTDIGSLSVLGEVFGNQRLPTDSVGSVQLSFSKVKPGSEIHVYRGDVEVAGVESANPGETLTLSKYAPGNLNNTVRIFIASLGYENLDFDIELTTDADVPTFQRIDRNYRNQA